VRFSGFNLIVIDLQKITWREAPKFFKIVEGEIKILIRKFDVKSCKNLQKSEKKFSVPRNSWVVLFPPR
jgi:hypothetical protein